MLILCKLFPEHKHNREFRRRILPPPPPRKLCRSFNLALYLLQNPFALNTSIYLCLSVLKMSFKYHFFINIFSYNVCIRYNDTTIQRVNIFLFLSHNMKSNDGVFFYIFRQLGYYAKVTRMVITEDPNSQLTQGLSIQ